MAEKLEIDALRALLSISTKGGVTRAAEDLNLSQSAVSHKIRRLERALDCDLLARRPGGPVFTEAGTRLIEYARRMINLHDEALADLGKKPLKGSIRLGVTEDVATSDVARALGRFTRLYPDVRVRTRTGQSLTVQGWLAADELDLAVMQIFESEIAPTDTLLFRDRLHWVKSRDFRLNLSQPIPFLSFDINCFYRQWGLGAASGATHNLEKVLECPSATGIQSALRAGLGIALLNGMHLTPDIEVIEGVFPPPPDIAFIARINRKSRSAATNALTAEIAECFPHAHPAKAAG